MDAEKPTKSKPTKTQLDENEARRRHELRMRRLAVFERLGLAFIIGGTIIGGGYVCVYLPIEVSQGETTVINVVQNWIGDLRADLWLGWGAAGGTGLWGWSERKKRIRERAEKDARIKRLEEAIDPNRTSSGMTPEGTDNAN